MIYQILSLLIFSAIIIFSIGVIIFFFFERNEKFTELENESTIISTRLLNNLAIPMWNFHSNQLETIIKHEINNKFIFAIILINRDGEIDRGQIKNDNTLLFYSPELKDLLKEASFSTENDVIYNGQAIGKLKIYFTDKPIFSEIRKRMLFYIILFSTSLAVSSFIVFYALKKIFINAILQLDDAVVKFTNRDFDSRVEIVSNNEISLLAHSFNTMAETIQQYSTEMETIIRERTRELVQTEKMASLGEMVAGVAHEINTPIGITITAATHMKKNTKDLSVKLGKNEMKKSDLDSYIENMMESTDIIFKNLYTASELILSFKQVSADRQSKIKRVFNVKEYMNEIILSLKPSYKNTKHKIILEIEDNININSYPGSFSQIITNLIKNSLIHGFEGIDEGEIKINVTHKNEFVILEYYDNGIGMTAENLKKIYEPFFTTKRGAGGTGLGMNIVYNIIKSNLKGAITCESSPQKGIHFTIVIPEEIE